jgi:hypothetical protein
MTLQLSDVCVASTSQVRKTATAMLILQIVGIKKYDAGLFQMT